MDAWTKHKQIAPILTESLLKQLYVDGKLSANEIGQRLNVSGRTIGKYLRMYNISIRPLSELSRQWAAKHTFPKGDQTNSWKGGRIEQGSGYIKIRIPEYPHADKSGYVFEHILVWEQVHGRPVPDGWQVHHLNGIKNDNRPENLIILPANHHSKHHLLYKDEQYKKRIRELEAKVKLLERALDSQQLIFWSEN